MTATSWVAFLQNVGCALTALVCLAFLCPARNPFRILWDLARTLWGDRRLAAAWGVYLLVIGTDLVLTRIDYHITAWLSVDFTAPIAAIEAPAWTLIQRAASPALDWLFTGAYILLFPQAVIICLVLYTVDRDRPAMRQFLAGFAANYILALPFYLFFPVREAWAFSGTDAITLRMDAAAPVLMQAYRPMSGIDNCFPSLHTSLAVTALLVARDRPRPRLAGFLATVAAATVLSIFYLGIHWITDAAAGVLLALLCHKISRRFASPGCGFVKGSRPSS